MDIMLMFIYVPAFTSRTMRALHTSPGQTLAHSPGKQVVSDSLQEEGASV